MLLFVLGLAVVPGLPLRTATAQSQDLVFERVGRVGGGLYSLVQDPLGYLWVHSRVDLRRYDGYRWTVFRHDPADSTSLSVDRGESMYVDRQGVLWIGTFGGGLNRYDPVTETFTRFQHDPDDPKSLSDNRVIDILEDRAGDFWIATYGGLDRMDRKTGTFTHFRHDPDDPASLSHDQARVLYEDRQGMLWVGVGDPFIGKEEGRRCCGLNRFDRETETFTRFLPDPDDPHRLNDGRISAIFEDSRGTFWVGTGGNDGLYTLDRATGTFTRHRYDPDDPGKPSQPHLIKGTPFFEEPVTGFIYEDREGILWIGAMDRGLNRYDPETDTHTHYEVDPDNPDDPRSLPSNMVWRICETRDGTLWIGSWGGEGVGLFKVAPRTAFPHYVLDPAGPAAVNEVGSIYEDREGTLWIGNTTGLYRYDRARRTALGHYLADLSEGSYVRTISQDRTGVLWVGTWGDGLFRFDPVAETFTPYRHRPGDETSLGDDRVSRIYEDRQGTLWIGTSGGGLLRMDRQRGIFEPFIYDPDDPASLNRDAVLAVLEDKEGVFWIGTPGNGAPGLIRFDRETRAYTEFFDGITVSSLHEDRKGHFWIGTENNGLWRFERETGDYRAFATHNSDLPNDEVIGIVEDEAGRLWLSTGGGLARFDPEAETFHTYPAQKAEPFSQRAFYRSPRGEVFVGGENGFHAFFPEDPDHQGGEAEARAPEVALTGFRLFDERILPGAEAPLKAPIWEAEELRLAHDQNVFSFDFAGFHYRDPSKNRHRYMLENFDDDWREAGADLTETYVKVPPGEYVFRVKAASSEGVSNEEGASIRVMILPPWWKTWWAYAVYGLFVLGAVAGAFRAQRTRLLRQAEVEQARLRSEAAELQARIEAEKAHELEAAYHQLKTTNEQLRHHENQLERQAQVLQEQTESLIELEQTKDRFFANITHEFRTPLTLILGPVQDALEGAYGSVSPGLHRQLESMKRNAQRLHRLIGQLLDLSRLDVGRVHLQARQRNLIPFLKGIVVSFSSLAERRRVTLQFIAETDALPLYFDADKLEKIVANLLSNAFKFTPEQGQVRVSVREAADAGERFAEIRIRDTGPGIPAEEATHIFDRFHQIDARPHRKNAGTGIGLALVYELVALHAGTIAVESEQGFGCEFTVRLPLGKAHLLPVDLAGEDADEEADGATFAPPMWLDEPASSHPVADPAETPGGPDPSAPTILIVEDNADVRVYLKDHLAALYHLVEAADGVEGLEAARAAVPDLIISDVMMPGMDGYALCRALKQDEHLNHIPVVLLTAKASDDAEVEGFGAGCDDYIYKPFNAEALLARVENMIEIRRLLRQRFSGEVVVQPSGVSVPSEEAVFLGRVQTAVEAHLGDSNFTVEWLADEVGLSPRQLGRRLQAAMRLSPSGFIRMMRLKRAAQLLAQQTGTVAEVAYTVGYDAKHFSRLFFQTFGVHPSEYRADQS